VLLTCFEGITVIGWLWKYANTYNGTYGYELCINLLVLKLCK